MKAKIKLMAFVAGLLATLPMSSAWAHSGTHYGKISVTASGEGTVYLSTVENATSGGTSAEWNCGGKESADSKTYYLYAQPATGWSFAGWSGSGTSSDLKFKVTPNASENEGKYSYTATFTKLCALSFQATENGTYTVTDGTSTIDATSEAKSMSTAKEVTMTAGPAAGYTVKTWWYQETGSDRVELGNNFSYSRVFSDDATVGVEFVVKGDTVLNKTTGVRYRSLGAAVAEAEAGNELELIDSDELATDVVLPEDVKFFIPAGKTYVVPSGTKLTVAGTVLVSGAMTVAGTVDGSGNLVKNLKVITQTGMGSTGRAPYVPCESMKYFKTTITAESGTIAGAGTVSCAQSPYVKIVRYNGECSYHALGASTTVVYCTVDLSVANNCIKDFSAVYDNLGSAFNDKKQDAGYAKAYKMGSMAVLLDNGTISAGSSNVASSFAIDCAGKTVSVSGNQMNNAAVMLAFNASSASMPKLTNGGAWFVNCDSCGVSSVNANSSDYSSNVRYFDCGKTSAPGYTVPDGKGQGGMFFYAGDYSTYVYTVSFKTNYRVYSGLFKNDPTSYLAENDLEVVKEGSYYRVRKQVPKTMTVKVGDQQYETLQEAVNAANGGTVVLLQSLELAEDVTVAADKSCTIELAGFGISGCGIVNRGTLRIEDSSNYTDPSKVACDITNYGTLTTVYGEYTGAFKAEDGTFTILGGKYSASLSGDHYDIKAGQFKTDVSALLKDRMITSSDGYYWVGMQIHGRMTQTTISGTDIAFDITPLDPASDLTLYRKYLSKGSARSEYTDEEWYRLPELYYSLSPIAGGPAECTLCFNREIKANTIVGYGKLAGFTKSGAITTNHPANTIYQTTIPQILASGNKPISYARFLSGDVDMPSAGVKNNSNENIGTTCTIAFQWGVAKPDCWYRDESGSRQYYDWYFHPIASYDYKFTGGDKMAMIDYVLKDTLQTAVNQVENNGTIMLANDCAEQVVVDRECSFTLDNNNFELTGAITAASGFEMSKSGNVYTFTANAVAQIGETTYAALAEAVAAAQSGDMIELLADCAEDITIPSGVAFNTNGKSFSGTVIAPEGYIIGNADGVYSAMLVVAKIGETKYISLADAIVAAQNGDTVTLLADITDFTGTIAIAKSITLDGAGHTISAKPVTTHRDIISAWTSGTAMLKLQSGEITIQNLMLDGDASHAYTYLITADNSGVSLMTENVALLHGGELTGDGTGAPVAEGAGYGAAIHLNNGAALVVKDGFTACSGGVNDGEVGVFPFTGILVDKGGANVSFNLENDSDAKPTVGIGSDLLLVGMPMALDVETAQAVLDYMKVPSRFVPYTLTLGDGSTYAFTGASPLGWNDIIDYGKKIMDVSTALGFEGLDKATTPVEVGLLTDTVLPEAFIFADTNLTVNGNGNALAGTIKYTDNAGAIENLKMGTEEQALVLDMTGTAKPVQLGEECETVNLVIKVPAGQTEPGEPVLTWPANGDASLDPENVAVQFVDPAIGEPTGDAGDLFWDTDKGIACIGPVEARLTGPTHEAPVYTTLAGAIALAQDGDTVTLLADIVDFTGALAVNKSITLDGAGHTISAKPVTTHRDIITAWTSGTAMLKLQSGEIAIQNLTLDGDASHAYTYLITADNSGVSLTTENVVLLHGGELTGDENGELVAEGAGYGAAIHLNNGAALVVKDGFTACSGGTNSVAEVGCFPFTGILVDSNGGDVSFDLADDTAANPTVGIGSDLLLVGMPMAIEAPTAQALLDYMKVPSRFVPYTLTLGDGSTYAFTGASPLGWNDIIDYGKEIMDVSTALGFEGLDKATTPVEVGLLTDTVLPETFIFADTNLTVNGNGNALSGTIKYTDDAGAIENLKMGTEEQPLVLDMSSLENPVELGNGVEVVNLIIKVSAEADPGAPVFTWDPESGLQPGEGVTVQLVDADGEITDDMCGLEWDTEKGEAYIVPLELGPGVRVTSISKVGTDVTLTWEGTKTDRHIVLMADSLEPVDGKIQWKPAITVEGLSVTLLDQTAAKRFYRVCLVKTDKAGE